MMKQVITIKLEPYLTASCIHSIAMLGFNVLKVELDASDGQEIPHVQIVQGFSGPRPGVVVLALPRDTALLWAARILGAEVVTVEDWFTKVLCDFCTFVVRRAMDNAGFVTHALKPAVVSRTDLRKKLNPKAEKNKFFLNPHLHFSVSVYYKDPEMIMAGNDA